MNVKKVLVSSVTLLSVALLTACSTASGQSSTSSQSGQVVTTTNKTSDEVNWDSLPTKEVSLTNEGLTITEAGTYVL